ncbi:MAG: hypothetical protein ACFE96_15610 [Candidatus Hermodarchaeota archaeon]
MEDRNVIALIMSILIAILIIITLSVLIFHVFTYRTPVYAIMETDVDGSTVENIVISEEYVGKVDTNTFILILAEITLAATIFYAGLLNYIKEKS